MNESFNYLFDGVPFKLSVIADCPLFFLKAQVNFIIEQR